MLPHSTSILFVCQNRSAIRSAAAHVRQMRNSSSLIKDVLVDNFTIFMTNSFLAQGVAESLKFMTASNLLGPTTSVLLLSVGLRLATVPVTVLAEKLTSQRMMTQNLVHKQVYEKMAAHYGITASIDEKDGKWTLNTQDQLILRSANELATENLRKHVEQKNLWFARLLALRVCLVPVWVHGNMGLVRYVQDVGAQCLPGFFWLTSLTQADPYMVLPLCMGCLALLNTWVSRWMFMSGSQHYRVTAACLDIVMVAIVIAGTKIMMDLPAILPLYWCFTLSTSLLQILLLQHPRVKRLLGIGPLPTDTPTPFRSLFRRRRFIPSSMF
uniref:Mitochondrial inner membrane protein COX18 n=1 Tax=Globodera pallida TaxID=36090 RepID=A0A183C0T6_GLOPA